ncbi:MAG TPA: hypothetical protein VEK11_03075 [Thermoanaerobaculia bacterium]|nr:hypothetical protein [Thermoanaerobaculia bacterium]
MHAIRATARYSRALHGVATLLEKLKIDAMFVGGVARAGWFGEEVSAGAIDLLALMTAPQRNQLAMMASNRGFRIEREELESVEELDLVPMYFRDEEGEIRVHVLLATNALYGRMIASAVSSSFEERTIRIPRAEDFALLLLMGEDQEAVRVLTSLPEFDLPAFRERLASIGLGGEVAAS